MILARFGRRSCPGRPEGAVKGPHRRAKSKRVSDQLPIALGSASHRHRLPRLCFTEGASPDFAIQDYYADIVGLHANDTLRFKLR
jgi:hypothetical protein